MKKRGFTLIELLAVIVILAIIALIAVPIVLGIINDSKKSSEKESINLYTDTVEKAITKKQMNDPNFNPDKCEIKDKGNLECFKGTTSLGILNIEMKGKTPTSGTILIDDEDIAYRNIVLNGVIYYESNIKLSEDVSPTGLSIGDKYTYKVNDNDTFDFYVLSIEGTGNNKKINLIMDRNICIDGTIDYANDSENYCNYKWDSNNDSIYNYSNSNGPITIMDVLYKATKNWTNVPNMNLDYDDITDNTNSGYTTSTYGYKGVTITDGVGYITKKDGTTQTPITLTDSIPIKARLPKLTEVVDAGCHIGTFGDEFGTCPIWLMKNLRYYNVSNDKYSSNNNSADYQHIYGYWLLASFPGQTYSARIVYYRGNIVYNGVIASEYGARPVITVSTSDLQ